MHIFEIDSFWVSQWIGDLAHAGRKSRSSRLREALDELCEVLEGAVRRAEHPRS
jgi:hypothetical protein